MIKISMSCNRRERRERMRNEKTRKKILAQHPCRLSEKANEETKWREKDRGQRGINVYVTGGRDERKGR